MDYEWDPAKAQSNARKHGVEFADAAIALEDEFAVTIAGPYTDDEERFVSLGMDAMGRLLITVFVFREDSLRIISSRRASKKEQEDYEAGL